MNRGGIRRCVAFGLCALISLTVSGSVSASAAPAGFRVLVSRAVVPGVRYIKLQNPTTPNLVYILRVNLTKPIKFGVGLAARKKAGFERTSAMAARYNAIAGINGDFDIWWSRPNRDFARMGRPGHDLAQNGSFKFSSMFDFGANFGVARNETARFIGQNTPTINLWVPHVTAPFPITQWNAGTPGTGEVAAFTVDGKTFPKAAPCSVRLRTDGRPTWSAKRQAITRRYRVAKVVCGRILRPYDGVTLAARAASAPAAAMRDFHRGQLLRIGWTMGWPHVWSTIGGVPILVSGGQLDIPTNCTDPFCNRNPRTGIGFTSDGTLLMVVVDGRSPKSRGMTLVQFARLFMRLGATDALNLDGGGSATMVVKGRVVNHPSDTTGERAVTSSALILPQVLRAMGVRASGPAGPGPGSAARAALSDPGSTGGMLDSVARGTFGPVRLGAAERRVVAAFRRG